MWASVLLLLLLLTCTIFEVSTCMILCLCLIVTSQSKSTILHASSMTSCPLWASVIFPRGPRSPQDPPPARRPLCPSPPLCFCLWGLIQHGSSSEGTSSVHEPNVNPRTGVGGKASASVRGTSGSGFTGGLNLDWRSLAHMEKSHGRTIRKSPAHSPLISFFPFNK